MTGTLFIGNIYGELDMVYERTDLASDAADDYQYRDEGCELAASCLNCPFPQCVYDLPGGGQRLLKERRDVEILRLKAAGKTIHELARLFQVSERTIRRVFKKEVLIHE